jgi:hypothetical protein
MRVGLLPLDERPANTRDPQLIAAIAGVDLALPPAELLSAFRTPAPADRLGAWLRRTAPQLDALIVSLEMLGYGGLIASRISDEPLATILQRLDVLRQIKAAHPTLPIYGFNVITRVSNADNAIEEPDYWAEYGTRLYRYSQLLDRQTQGEAVDAELAALLATIPAEHRRDLLGRRLRNHSVNLAALQLLADNVFDLLVLSSDDTSPYGLPSREKRWLSAWAAHLDLLPAASAERPAVVQRSSSIVQSNNPESAIRNPQLLMYPGADEVGCALLARLINRRAGRRPRVEVLYGVSGGAAIVAPFEDGPVHVTVERQITAIDGQIVTSDGDLLLAVNPPVPRRSEWHPDWAAQERAERLPQLQRFVATIRDRIAAGGRVVVADVAYPNGADPVLSDLLRAEIDLLQLAAYGAWNTAGNTIGTALAQGCATLSPAADPTAQLRFLLLRLVEDWGYQQGVRQAARAWLRSTTGSDDPTASNRAATIDWITHGLRMKLLDLPGFQGWTIANVRLPWGRLFEVDVDLVPPPEAQP